VIKSLSDTEVGESRERRREREKERKKERRGSERVWSATKVDLTANKTLKRNKKRKFHLNVLTFN